MLERDTNRRRLEKLISKLRKRTVANGCTVQEAATARTTVERLQRVSKHWNATGLSPDELRRVRAWLASER